MHPRSSKFRASRHFWKIPSSKKAYDTIADLAAFNPLLFRISHKNSGSYYFEGHGVVASEHYVVDPETGERHLSNTIEQLCERSRECTAVSTDKLIKHVLYDKTERTRFVSASFSFPWALFFAEMNATCWKEEDVEFLVINTFAVAHRAWVVYEKLSGIGLKRDKSIQEKMLNAAYSSQEVMVVDCIPESAIISRMRWEVLKEKLPSWFYEPVDCIDSRRIIPIPNDGQWQKYARWQKAVRDRLHQLSATSFLRWECVSRSQVVAFVLAVLSLEATPDEGTSLLNGKKTRQELEDMAQSVARDLLKWSRDFSSRSLETEDMVQLPKMIMESMVEKMPGTRIVPLRAYGDYAISPGR